MATYLRFDRHALFTTEMMTAHSSLINDVEEYLINEGIRDNNFVNSLYGIWDGYLYTDLLLRAMEYPSDIYDRVLDVYREISDFTNYNN
jgi:hypothetical protein